MDVYIIAPDRASGDAFAKKIQENGISVHIAYPTIAPRVIGETLSKNPKVTADLQKAIDNAEDQGHTLIAIACNTLQLWIPRTQTKRATIATTLEAAQWKYKNDTKKPIWLGTTPTVTALHASHLFPSLLDMGAQQTQRLCQEIVWRTKAVTKVDIQSAFTLPEIDNPQILDVQTMRFLRELSRLHIPSVILGCTELPIAVSRLPDSEERKRIECIDPADILAQYILSQ